MYDSQVLVERIKERANSQGIGMVKLHEMCGISRNVVSQTTSRKKGMTAENLYSIAEVLDCSVDYLLGRSDLPNPEKEGVVKNNHNNIVQGINAVEFAVPVTVSQETQLDENQQELLTRFGQLSYKEKLRFMQELVEKTEGIE